MNCCLINCRCSACKPPRIVCVRDLQLSNQLKFQGMCCQVIGVHDALDRVRVSMMVIGIYDESVTIEWVTRGYLRVELLS